MSLIATRTLDFIQLNPRFDKNMTRPQEYGALDFFIQQTDAPNSIITEETKQRALASIGNTVKIPVIAYDGDVTIANARSCTIPANDNTSALVTVSFVTYATGFRMFPNLYLNNYITYQHDWNRKFEKILRKLANALDTAAIATLEANKSQVFADPLIYSVSGNALQVPYNYRNEILGDLNPIMRANDYHGDIHVVGNAGVDSLVRKLAEHGLYNDENKRMEYADKVFHFTNNLTNASQKYGTFYAVEDGNVALLTRLDRAALAGSRVNEAEEFGRVYLPMVGLEVGTHYKKEVGNVAETLSDDTSVADMTCDLIEYFGFSVDVAFLTAYNSAPSTIANPIVKAQIGVPAAGAAAAQDVNVIAAPATTVDTTTPLSVVIGNTSDNPVPTQEITG